MSREIAFVLINPYTIAKSRTGGVIARCVGRTDLDFVAARMFGPSQELVDEYSEMIECAEPDSATCRLIAEYIRRSYAPDPQTDRPRRVMMLLFEGEDAIAKIWKLTGSATLRSDTGETIRDTYGDYIVGGNDDVHYFEPAVLVAPSRKRAAATLSLWVRYSEACGGIVAMAKDVPEGDQVERTLVLLKPDNFRFPSSRAGNIIDLLSSSGLRIVGVRRLCMSVAQAMEFYGPVKEALRARFGQIGSDRVARALTREFGFDAVPREALEVITRELGPLFAEAQFDSIVKFMTGYTPSQCTPSEQEMLGSECCLALVYEGHGAVGKIRGILGPTDPRKARPGSVRREFGSDIMVNAAHASDSVENAQREIGIVQPELDSLRQYVDRYYGGTLTKLRGMGAFLPKAKSRWLWKLKERWKCKTD